MLAALTARWRGMQNGALLTGIQMPPLPLRLMIVEDTARSTFRAGPFQFGVSLELGPFIPAVFPGVNEFGSETLGFEGKSQPRR